MTERCYKCKPDAGAAQAREVLIGWPDGETPEVVDGPNALERGAVRFVERSALDRALAEVRDAKRTLAEYEHECETVNEMRDERDAALARVAELERELAERWKDIEVNVATESRLKKDRDRAIAERDEARENAGYWQRTRSMDLDAANRLIADLRAQLAEWRKGVE